MAGKEPDDEYMEKARRYYAMICNSGVHFLVTVQ